jgi:hypothetical protein
MFEWDDEIVDIREHYPLLDLAEVVKDRQWFFHIYAGSFKFRSAWF